MALEEEVPSLIRMPGTGDWIDGRFLLQECLGKGGYGVVYKARQRNLQRHVAVKMLLPHALNHATVIARFEREARLVSALHHPNTVVVHSFGVHRWEDEAIGVPFLVMEYLTGETLQSYLDRVGVLPPGAALDILLPVLESLAEAHGKGAIHRDIKPGNVFLATRDGAPQNVKVLDFGVAKVFDREHKGDSLTATGMTPGTVDYMAPDLAMGKTLTPSVDVYAAGCMAFRMVVGHVPFRGKTPLEVSIKHVSAPIPALPPEVEKHPIAGLIRQSMSKNPRERFSNAAHFARAVSKVRSSSSAWSSAWSSMPPIELSQGLPHETSGQPAKIAAQKPRVSPAAPTPPGAPSSSLKAERSGPPARREPPRVAPPEDIQRSQDFLPPEAQSPPEGQEGAFQARDALAMVAVGILLSIGLAVAAFLTYEKGDAAQTLEINSVPNGAEVYLGKEKMGETPLLVPHPREKGTIELILFKQGYRLEKVLLNEGNGYRSAAVLTLDDAEHKEEHP